MRIGHSTINFGRHRIDGPSYIGRHAKSKIWREYGTFRVTGPYIVDKLNNRIWANLGKEWCIENDIDPDDLSDFDILVVTHQIQMGIIK